jgi:hypothetical protein
MMEEKQSSPKNELVKRGWRYVNSLKIKPQLNLHRDRRPFHQALSRRTALCNTTLDVSINQLVQNGLPYLLSTIHLLLS